MASSESLKILESITAADVKRAIFDDTLVTLSDAGQELGEFVVSVSESEFESLPCILVKAQSHGTIDDIKCGTSVTAHLSYTLETLQQQHQEYVNMESQPLLRDTSIHRQDSEYVVNMTVKHGEETQNISKIYTYEQMKGVVPEGCSLVLQRLLVMKQISSSLQLLCLDTEATLAAVNYTPLEQRVESVGGTDIETWGIERTIHPTHEQMPISWHSYYTADGFLVNRMQVGSPVSMKLRKLPEPRITDETEEKPTFPKQPLNWEEDMQLRSQFMDMKNSLKADHAQYIRHHPELRALVGDFTQQLLIRKPADVVAFGAEYFASFSSKTSDNVPYLQSAAPDRFPNSRTTSAAEYRARAIGTGLTQSTA